MISYAVSSHAYIQPACLLYWEVGREVFMNWILVTGGLCWNGCLDWPAFQGQRGLAWLAFNYHLHREKTIWGSTYMFYSRQFSKEFLLKVCRINWRRSHSNSWGPSGSIRGLAWIVIQPLSKLCTQNDTPTRWYVPQLQGDDDNRGNWLLRVAWGLVSNNL